MRVEIRSGNSRCCGRSNGTERGRVASLRWIYSGNDSFIVGASEFAKRIVMSKSRRQYRVTTDIVDPKKVPSVPRERSFGEGHLNSFGILRSGLGGQVYQVSVMRRFLPLGELGEVLYGKSESWEWRCDSSGKKSGRTQCLKEFFANPRASPLYSTKFLREMTKIRDKCDRILC